MISIKIYLKWGVCQPFLLTLVFYSMGKLGQIGSNQTPGNNFTLDPEIKKLGLA